MVYDEDREGCRIDGDAGPGSAANSRCSNSESEGKLCLNSLGELTVTLSISSCNPPPPANGEKLLVAADDEGTTPLYVLRSNDS